MRPWMGAFAAAAAIAVLPASALADDGQSVYEFKLPNKATADQLIKLGYDLGDGLDQSQPGFVKATIDATPSEKAPPEATGDPGAAAKTPKSAAVGTVPAQHADYWEDAGGRWLSVEGTPTQAAVTPPRTYS